MSKPATWQDYANFIKSKANIEEVMIISSEDGALWGCSPKNFFLREYAAQIVQESGEEKEETVNEAASILKFMRGQSCHHGVRLNGGKKQQVIRNFKDEGTGLQCVYGKIAQGGSCVANAGKCIIIATFSEANGHTSSGCNDVVQQMAKYLAKSKWPQGEEPAVGGGGGGGGSADSSWQGYVDTMLVGKGNIHQALICSKIDGSVWGHTQNFTLQNYEAEIVQEDGSDKLEMVDEAKNLLQLMKGSKPSQGLRLNSEKFQILRQFDDDGSKCYTVLGKRMKGGCCVAVTNKTIIVGTFDEGQGHAGPACNTVVLDLAKHLKSSQN